LGFRAYYLDPKGDFHCCIAEEEARSAYESKQGLLWVDVHDTTEDDGGLLERTFGFHHLAVEDCVSPRLHQPKIDDFGDHLFIVVHGVNHMAESNLVETTELAIFLGRHFVVTNHNYPLYSVESIIRLVEDDGRPMRRGADFLAHALVDALIDNILPTIDIMGERAEDIEEEVIRNPKQPTLEAILQLKRSAVRLHRVVAPQREVINRLSRGEFALISEQARIFYRDIYDHLLRIEDLNQSLRDRASDGLSTYLSSVANRQNEVMKVLSMAATIFLPLTLLAGIYGMNFENMPELKYHWGYFAVLGLMGGVILIVMWRFWSRSWLTWGQRQVTRLRPFAVEPEKLRGYIGHMGRKH